MSSCEHHGPRQRPRATPRGIPVTNLVTAAIDCHASETASSPLVKPGGRTGGVGNRCRQPQAKNLLRAKPTGRNVKSLPVAAGKVMRDAATVKSRRYGDTLPKPLSLMPAIMQ
jgi:hypothetical protein